MATNLLRDAHPLGALSHSFFNQLKQAAAHDQRIVLAGALVLVREIKLELSKPGTGIYYGPHKSKTGRRVKGHKASAPGQPPAVDTGVLRNTIDAEVIEQENKVRVGSGQVYASYLEFGTTRIKQRPFMRHSFERARKQMTHAVVGQLKRRGGGAG